MKLIKISVEAKTLVPFESLVVVQGNLKELDKKNYDKLKKSILKYGITAAFNVWINQDKKYEILDGTQRHRVITNLIADGYDCEFVPINLVQADSKKEAMQILLTHASQYGTPDYDGFYEFITDCNLDPAELAELTTFDSFFNFDSIDLNVKDFEKINNDSNNFVIKCSTLDQLIDLRSKFSSNKNSIQYEQLLEYIK